MAGLSTWTIEQRRAIVAEYEVAPYGSKQLVLRRHRVTGSQIRTWASSRDAGLLESGGSMRKGNMTPREESAELARLRERIARLEDDLDRARGDIADRQRALDSLGKATALLQELVSGKNAAEK